MGYRQEEGIDYDEVFAPVARIEAIKIFLAFASYMGSIVYQMDVKSALLYGTIDEEVYMSQHPSFVDHKFPKKVYKVVKALYGLHQALRSWYATLFTFLLKSGYRRGTIDKTLFIKKDKNDIMLVQVYVDDIIFVTTKRSWCDEFEALMKSRFQMRSMGELIFFLGLQVKQKEDCIFISRDKYVAEILKKFDFASVKTISTLIETQKPLTKDEEAADVDVTPKTSQLHAVKRIFRYLKDKPKLGLWYSRVSSFDLEAYSDSDYAGANLDRKRRDLSGDGVWILATASQLSTASTSVSTGSRVSTVSSKLARKIYSDWDQHSVTTHARERERKARTTLLMSIPEDHLAKFHKMTDTKEMWEAIKSRFCGNDESKKMQKYILKQQFESFSISNSEGLHKGYDRTKPGVDSLSFDDLYYNIRVFETDVKGSTGSSSSAQNVAFVSSSTSSTNDVSIAYGVSTSSRHNSQREGSSSYTNELMYSFFANQSSGLQLDHEDLNRELCKREYRSKGNQESRRRDAENTGYKVKDNGRRPGKQEEPKALVTLDGDGVDWIGHAEDKQENFALMTYSNSGSDTEVTSCSKECEEWSSNQTNGRRNIFQSIQVHQRDVKEVQVGRFPNNQDADVNRDQAH
ncbi:putative ribonuclease H-like domain-containing protein [Tanacetum coccineum]